jgi:hypothetical protein
MFAKSFDFFVESESSSDEDNLSLIDSESEAENSDEMEEDDNSDDDEEEDGDSEEVEDDGVEQKEEIEEPTVDSRTRKKRKSDTGEENMELDC